ncbi:MAG TPA: ribonuclease J [Acidobacteriota bacterium]|nr:ribonuclease J [Acidobacteriota bacterium]
MGDYVEVIPLGGLGEFGMNCTAIRSGSDLILVDAGMAFPQTDQGAEFGVNVIVPDLSFLKEHRDEFRAILLTHGHEDHAGAVSFIINEIPVPVYGSPLTLGLVESRLKERNLEGVELIPIEARKKLQFGQIEVEPLHVTHSFPDCFCFAFGTPVGTLIWTGDFKFDQTPVDRKVSDLHRLAAYGENGVLALFSDSTNSTSAGLAPSEFSVYEPLRSLFRKAEQKIIVSTFASSINRIQILMDLAREFDRFVLPAGRSMTNTVRTARDLGYLKAPADLIINIGDLRHLDPRQVVVLASGSQGEPMSAMSRLAVDQFRNVEVEEGDMVILSARIIPGNEKPISRMINHMYRRGARVYDPHQSQVHVSGHGFREDLKLMINLTRPRFFIPIHGEYKQLKSHAWLAMDQGIPEENVRILENGDVLQLNAHSARIAEKLSIGRRFIDDGILEEVHTMVLRERRFLSEDGFVVVVLRMDRLTGDLIGEPEILSKGFLSVEQSEDVMNSARDLIITTVQEASLEEKQDEELFNEILRKRLMKFFRKNTGKRPIILSMTIEI